MVEYTFSDFNIKKLGSFYRKDKTIFRVFAPESKEIILVIKDVQYKMHQNHYYFEIALSGDLEKEKYYYVNDIGIEFRDPFAYYSDDKYSYILDKDKFDSVIVTPKKLKDIIIYEASVRDFSCDESFISNYKRKLLSISENGLSINNYFVIGLDYLKNLGITHLQLLPIFAFSKAGSDYNWGYNPIAFNYINKDYIYNQNNPYAFINEMKQVVNILHDNDIRVTLDVVFNHVYDADNFDLEKMIPGHIFRKMEDGSLAKGSLCGNELKSEDPFVKEYLCEMVERYVRLFDIDGIRIDQMGILDYNTVNLINEQCKRIKYDFIVYGEGWNMGDVLPENERASINNSKNMLNIAMFNDYFRDTIINYVSGNDSIKEEVKNVLSGRSNNLFYYQSINYVECHDNYTFFDRMLKYKQDDPEWVIVRRCKLALALVLLARGIAFIHAGQEFLRTKGLIENSYNSDESINKIDWNRRVEHNDLCDYLKGLIEFRKNNHVFINDNISVSFEDYYECLIYKLDNIMIIINPCMWDHTYQDGNNYNIIYDLNGKTDYLSDVISIPAYSVIICKQ